MPDIATEYACPSCSQVGVKNQIIATGGNRLTCRGNSAHTWTDTMEFIKLRPTMEFRVAAQQAPPQTAHTTMQVTLPMNHKTILEAKLGGKLQSTVAGILSMLAEGEVMIVPAGDIQRIKQLLGQTPQNSGELFGIIYALHLQNTEAKDNERRAMEEVAAYEGLNKDLVVLDVKEVRQTLDEKAKAEGIPVKIYLSRYLRNAVENNWL